MTNQPNRLDRVEDELETVKQILLTVARQYEDTSEQMAATDKRIDQTTHNVNAIAARIDQLASDADADRQMIWAGLRQGDVVLERLEAIANENQQILNYLFGQQRGNGHSGEPQT